MSVHAYVKVAIFVLLQDHSHHKANADNSNVARTENSRYLSSAAYEFANNQVKLPVFSLLTGDTDTLALHGVGNRKSDDMVACDVSACEASNHSDIVDISSASSDESIGSGMAKG